MDALRWQAKIAAAATKAMSLEGHFKDFLRATIDDGETKSRNIEAIAYYYGMGDAPWPTLEEVADKFAVGTRERMRQLLHLKLRSHATVSDIPSLARILDLLHSKDFWIASDLENTLISLELLDGHHRIKGILNLAEDLGQRSEYDLLTYELGRITRNSLQVSPETYLVRRSHLQELDKLRSFVVGLPGKCGIANLASIRDKLAGSTQLFQSVIEVSPSSWVKRDGDNFWYIFENRENPILGFSKKVFAVINECDSGVLAASFRNALQARTCQYGYPDESIILAYLESSVHFAKYPSSLRFLGPPGALSDIESDVVSYLHGGVAKTFPELKQHLLNLGYGEPHVIKTANYSPLISVDRRLGRRNHIYSLIPDAQARVSPEGRDVLYDSYLLILRSLLAEGTDIAKSQNSRKEQEILKDWLFKDKKHERCAICDREYSVASLVTAHKKKRSECNDAERLDPYIVMPLCKMGCDYLYEHMYIYILDGKVAKGLPMENARAEADYIAGVLGREIEKRWLMGSPTYFRRPD